MADVINIDIHGLLFEFAIRSSADRLVRVINGVVSGSSICVFLFANLWTGRVGVGTTSGVNGHAGGTFNLGICGHW